MQFKNITGQKETKEQLVQMVQHNRLSHALLFLGKEGSGALSLAMAFAQYIVCEKVNGNKEERPESSLFGEEAVAEKQAISRHDSCGVCDRRRDVPAAEARRRELAPANVVSAFRRTWTVTLRNPRTAG